MGVADYIGEQIKVMCKSRRMTQADLAKAIGQSSSSITMYETGRRTPDFETLEAIADVFNVPLSSIVGYEPHEIEPGEFYRLEMFEKYHDEMDEIAEVFTQLSPELQKVFMKFVRSLYPD